jgi:FtsZ-interacting cell division protein ZipA
VSTMQIVWIIVLAVVIIALIGLVGYVMNKKKMEQNRARAESLRSEAGSAATVIPEAQVRAREAEARAERARLDAQKAEEDAARANQTLSAEQAQYEDRVREADRLDPAVDHRASDYHPDTSTAEVEQPSYDAGGRIETDKENDNETDEDDPDTHPATHPTHTVTTSADGQPIVTRVDSRDQPTDGAHRA